MIQYREIPVSKLTEVGAFPKDRALIASILDAAWDIKVVHDASQKTGPAQLDDSELED